MASVDDPGGPGEEARDLVRRRKFDIVLVDLYMSQVSGLELPRGAGRAPRHDRGGDDRQPQRDLEHRGAARGGLGLPAQAVQRDPPSRC